MGINNKYGVEDFAAEIAAISDHGSDSVDECEFCEFCKSVHAAMNIEEGEVEGEVEGKEGKEEDGPLYRMEVLTSEADVLMSSPSKAMDNFLPSEEDHEDNLIARKVAVKGKGEVMGKGRQVKRGKDLIMERKTKGALLWEMITTACDQPNGGNACRLLHGPVNSKGVGLYVSILASPYHHDVMVQLDES